MGREQPRARCAQHPTQVSDSAPDFHFLHEQPTEEPRMSRQAGGPAAEGPAHPCGAVPGRGTEARLTPVSRRAPMLRGSA